ncbi:YihY/virulence factor BrkB family protein [Qipengyuania nanhaisediminis]|uniref:Membrane protein n=1 Tax=Qipengyuania nanhaisediminis TaxID=604088 RepID=A0A1I5KXG6_9SPHN|nr:YihY/virulence factor BrkB family protein [Qipengyuania nanhaisediminis]SFO89316.1 membrane protein [Qipengyuania nanhaisediminis]
MLDDLKAAWARGGEDNIGIIAAGVAHYALLALVPTLGAVVLGYGLFADPETVAGHIATLSENLPASAAELIGDQLKNVSEGAAGAKGFGLLLSLAIALFGARNGARALMTGLNIALGAKEERGFVKGNLVALLITIAGVVGLAAAGGVITAIAAVSGPIGDIAGFATLLLVASGAAALLYRFAPNKPAPDWDVIWPGAILFAVTWIAATAAFAYYAANFGNYNATYGSLGAVIVLITWFYASGFFLLLGAELVAERAKGARTRSTESVADSQ